MAKVVVFLSHITEEKALAEIIKGHIERDFIGLIDVFVSSDDRSINIGRRWLSDVDNALRTAAAMIVLCSPDSVKRPWINFEAGAAWIREIPVAPVCHTGMQPSGLPVPLNLLQAIDASREQDWEGLYRTIAGRLDSTIPSGQFTDLVEEVTDFERDYRFIRHVRESILTLIAIKPKMRQLFVPDSEINTAEGRIPSHQIDQMRAPLASLQNQGILKFSLGNWSVTLGGEPSGSSAELSIQIDPSYQEIAEQVMSRV
jgi:TIR domain